MRPLQNCTHARFHPAHARFRPAHVPFRPACVPFRPARVRFRPAGVSFCHSRESGNPETRIHLLNRRVPCADRIMQKSLNKRDTP